MFSLKAVVQYLTCGENPCQNSGRHSGHSVVGIPHNSDRAPQLAGRALRPSPVQMYEGPSLPKEQVGIVRGACQTGPA